MKKRSPISSNVQGPITRARAKALGNKGVVLTSSMPSFEQDQRPRSFANTKRAAEDENKAPANGFERRLKKRAVLKDSSNIIDGICGLNCRNKMDIQKTDRQLKGGPDRSGSAFPSNVHINRKVKDVDAKISGVLPGVNRKGISSSRNVGQNEPLAEIPPVSDLKFSDSSFSVWEPMVQTENSRNSEEIKNPEKLEEDNASETIRNFSIICIPNIDSNWRDTQLCTSYVREIYENHSILEINQRPSSEYMQNIQEDITPYMRSILVNWLVEVADELKYVPDTLYLSVNLLDRFLSQTSIDRRRLQLLGATCTLIATKFEEIVSAKVGDFCDMMDKAHTREEVLEMENQVLNRLQFWLAVPTTKTFVRRFVQVAHATYKGPRSTKLEFLANYLAELSLMDYNFLKYLPSLVAASAVFLAKWTLNQSDNPWNPILEHYTSYAASDLKTVVLELEQLQLNTMGCSLTAVRDKYKRVQFHHVATLTSTERVISLFS